MLIPTGAVRAYTPIGRQRSRRGITACDAGKRRGELLNGKNGSNSSATPTSGGRISDDGIEAARRYLRVRGLTVGQVARVLRMNERTVRSWAERGTLDFQLIGGKRYLLTVHLVAWARSRGWVLFWEEVL